MKRPVQSRPIAPSFGTATDARAFHTYLYCMGLLEGEGNVSGLFLILNLTRFNHWTEQGYKKGLHLGPDE